ncbi:MAG: 50S ribosomal protein L25/general stress protein Ctc [Rhodospirillaceae bacterium]|nr:50S ribosomal protein L25/general stress protein Ctc [Rhodospirillaceae bacterium]|tara:strand:- start:32 stop:721 length:690 start_codon:yes stop_codon:yes gene_type:complete
MSVTVAMNAEVRDRAGKGAARAVRRAGRVPAVIYGGKKEPAIISLDPRDIIKGVESGEFFSTIYEIKLESGLERVLPRDLQVHPINDLPQHLDFLRVTAETRVTVEVPVNFLNEEESPGLKRGGVLNVVRYAVEVNCSAEDIPVSFDLDLAGLEIGDGLHSSSLILPTGVDLTITDRDFTIASVAAPTVVEEETTETGDGEEGEIGEDGAESDDASEDASDDASEKSDG